ncbi:MAG: hypothetical protein M3452_03935 [Chloroflexota bacterium]|nr:hypothetical protein [Chloroflexota bacterium]
MELHPIRVWLEPGYDYGRYGAWMLDWPGCFVWAGSREDVLTRVPGAVRRHAGWLAGFGEDVVVPVRDDVEVVEEVAARVDDGYERNATFTVDRRPVAADELERMLRRLGFARADLGRLLERVAKAHPDGSGAASDGASDDTAVATGAAMHRKTEEVLRHVAGAEIWLGSRLDRTLRYGGAPRDGELTAYLAGTRAWLLDQLRDLQAREPAPAVTDGKGEEWTLAKVLRRALYHSLDHLVELEARSAPELDSRRAARRP